MSLNPLSAGEVMAEFTTTVHAVQWPVWVRIAIILAIVGIVGLVVMQARKRR